MYLPIHHARMRLEGRDISGGPVADVEALGWLVFCQQSGHDCVERGRHAVHFQ